MLSRKLVCCLVHLALVLSVDGVSLSLNPPSMVIGSSTVIDMTSLNMQCSSSGTLYIKKVLELKISRRKITEPTFVGIATMTFDGLATFDETLPFDIKERSPNIIASLDIWQSSGTMTLLINAQGLACTDEAEFQCSLIYAGNNDSILTVTDNKKFTVKISSGGTAGPTIQPGSNINSSTVVAIVLGLVIGVFVLVILSVCLHRYRKLADLQSQKQSRAHTYDGLTETRQSSGSYAVLNISPSDGNVRLEENSYVSMAHDVF